MPAEPGPGHRHAARRSPTTRPRARCTDAQQRRRAVDRHQLRAPARRCTSPTCPPTRSRSTTAPRRRRRPGPTSRPSAANGCPQGSTESASTRSCSPTTRPAAPSSRSWPARTRSPATPTTTARPGTPSTGGGIPSRRRPPDHRRRRLLRRRRRRAAHLDYPNAVYYCSQDIADRVLRGLPRRRHDLRRRRPDVQPARLRRPARPRQGRARTARRTCPNKGCGADQAVVVSKDNGTDLDRPQGARRARRATPTRPSGVGANGTVYFGYVGADGTPGRRGQPRPGQDLDRPARTSAPSFGIQNAVFPTVVAGDDDRAAFAYLGTPTGGNYQDNAELPRRLAPLRRHHLRRRQDLGDQRRDARTTRSRRGSICTGGTTCGNDRNLLDFIDVTVDDHGRVAGRVRRRLHRRLRHRPEPRAAATPTPRSRGRAAAGRCSRSTTRPARPR